MDDEVELDVELDDEVLVELEVLTLPEEVETLPDEVLTLPELVDTLPELVEVEVEILPELVLDELPPLLVLVDPPEVDVEPVLVEVMTT